MLRCLFFSILFFWAGIGICQFGPQQIISTEAHLPVCAVSGDIDGDGNLDVAIASRSFSTPYNLAWFSNTNGNGNFGPINLIGSMSETKSIYLADLDNDGDMDVLATASFLDIVAWYENLDGLGNFSPRKIISSSSVGAFSAIAADIDADGDNDVISASDGSGLAWYENLDGNGTFSATKIIDNNIDNSRSVVAADLDGDGDLDIVGNGIAPNTVRIFWYENLDGLGNFGPLRVIRDFSVYANMLFVADADGDGDMDVFSASNGDNEVAWHENLDGLGNFGPKNIITNSLPTAFAVYAADLDNDNDIDVLATSVETFGGEIVWFENLDGLGGFGEKQIITTEVQSPRSVIAADIDNDGDMDVVSSSQNDDKIAWYENMTIMGTAENEIGIIKVYPNPTKGWVFINSNTEIIESVTIFDILGKNIFQQMGNIQQVDLSKLQSGMYFLLITTDGRDFMKKILKN